MVGLVLFSQSLSRHNVSIGANWVIFHSRPYVVSLVKGGHATDGEKQGLKTT